MEIPYLYQLQEANFTDLSNTDFKIAVVDFDYSGLTAAQIDTLQIQGKIMFSYLSIGEAEDYRDYWIQDNWSVTPPSFILNENNQWKGNYRVKYWVEEWQQIILNQVEDIISKGYNGVYLDVLDAYQDANVIGAYDGSTTTRQEIIDFTIRISEYAKSINPDFKIIPQNALELLLVNEEVATHPNLPFLNAIDGVGIEDTWTTGNPGGRENITASWTTENLSYLELAAAAGKFILSTDYATKENLQTQFIANAVDRGFIPFIGTRELDGTIDKTNYTSLAQMPDNWLNVVISTDITTPQLPPTTPKPPETPVIENISFTPPTGKKVIEGTYQGEEIQGNKRRNILSGLGGDDILYGERGNDIIYDGAGNDTVWAGKGNDTLYAGAGDDLLAGEGGRDLFIIGHNNGHDLIDDFTRSDRIKLVNSPYNSALEAYQALHFDGDHSILDLGDNNSITILWVSPTEINPASFEVVVTPEAKPPEAPVIENISFTPPTGSGVIEGTDNGEEVQGDESSNILSGLGGPDILYGEGGDDIIYDGAGDDTVWAGTGNDTLYAGEGNDLLAGEGGNDLFIIGPNNGQDLIDDLTLGDKIKLVNSPYQSALEAYQALSFDGDHSTLDLGDSNSIKILWVSPTEIDPAIFEVDDFIG